MKRPLLAAGAALALTWLPAAAHAGLADQWYRWPTVQGAPVSAHYDNNGSAAGSLDWSCGNNSYNGHSGTDIAIPKNTDVFAAHDGWVKKRADGFGDGYLGNTDGGGFGNHVALFHGEGNETIYGHLLAGTGIPGMGETITCGTRIGGSGTSGSSTGPHLHFETRSGVDENGSYYSGAADDPYAGDCSGPISFWVDQNGGAPTSDCRNTAPPDPCAGIPASGACEGTVLTRCEGGVPITRDCAADGLGCGDDGSGSGALACTGGPDGDGDGAPAAADCDDADPTRHPGAVEACDGVDNDCSGAADEDLAKTCASGAGMATCEGGAWIGCAPGDEPADDAPGDPTANDLRGGGCAAGGAADGGAGVRSGWASAVAALVAFAGLARVRRRRRPSA